MKKNKTLIPGEKGEKEVQIWKEIVKATARNRTIFRCSWFNQNFSESLFLEPILAGFVALPKAAFLEPLTDADDIAAEVAEVLYGQNSSITNYIEKVLGRKSTNFTDYALKTAPTGIWNTINV